MSLVLSNFVNGDVDYVNKLNNNNTSIIAAVVALQNSLNGSANSPANVGVLLLALFGSTTCFIGKSSYNDSLSGSNFVLTGGTVWKPSTQTVATYTPSTTLSFNALASGTYYITVDISGVPSISGSSLDAIYSVVWTGTDFDTIVQIANVFLDADDQTDLSGGGGTPTVTQILVTSPDPPAAGGLFQVAHGLATTPNDVEVKMTSDGSIRFQIGTLWDDTNVYLVASAGGLTCVLVLW